MELVVGNLRALSIHDYADFHYVFRHADIHFGRLRFYFLVTLANAHALLRVIKRINPICSHEKGFQNNVGTTNEVKATHDLFICITCINGNETLIKLYNSSLLAVQGMYINKLQPRRNQHEAKNVW